MEKLGYEVLKNLFDLAGPTWKGALNGKSPSDFILDYSHVKSIVPADEIRKDVLVELNFEREEIEISLQNEEVTVEELSSLATELAIKYDYTFKTLEVKNTLINLSKSRFLNGNVTAWFCTGEQFPIIFIADENALIMAPRDVDTE